jgi:hypothetical protein
VLGKSQAWHLHFSSFALFLSAWMWVIQPSANRPGHLCPAQASLQGSANGQQESPRRTKRPSPMRPNKCPPGKGSHIFQISLQWKLFSLYPNTSLPFCTKPSGRAVGCWHTASNWHSSWLSGASPVFATQRELHIECPVQESWHLGQWRGSKSRIPLCRMQWWGHMSLCTCQNA